jgi:hypothetical protein
MYFGAAEIRPMKDKVLDLISKRYGRCGNLLSVNFYGANIAKPVCKLIPVISRPIAWRTIVLL